jgi:DNA replication protein DnaC
MGYPKQVYDNAWQTLRARQDDARRTETRRREEIRRKLPEVERLERQLSAMAAGITKAVVTTPQRAEAEIARLGQESLALQRRREELLAEAGYPADYLAEQHHCDKCRDTGFVGVARCSCFDSLLRAEAHAFLGTMSAGDKSSFDSFRLDYYPEEPAGGSSVIPRRRMGEVLRFCRRYAENFSGDAQSLLLTGQTGLGKTHISLAIAHAVTEKGYGVLYSSAQQLMDRLESERFSRAPESDYRDNLQIVLSCDLLILDDLGTEFATSFTASTLYNIINTRMIESRPVIVSTNLDPAEIEGKYGQRMASRLLCEYKVLKFFGKDIRFLRKLQG